MRKAVLILATTLFLVFMMGIVAYSAVHPDTYHKADPQDARPLGKLAITLLIPDIQKAVDGFYASYLTVSPAAIAYFDDASVTKLEESESMSRYQVTIELAPYIGPHLSVGRDRLSFEVNAAGEVHLREFTHLESFALPEDYQLIVKKPLP